MPLFLHENLEGPGEIGIWQVAESEAWFLDRLDLSLEEQAQFEGLKGRRGVEWLAVRYLVHQMSGRTKRGVFLKDEFGKPRLENSQFQISISHSNDMAAAIAAPNPVGIDIQFLVAKIERLAHKYMRPVEMDSLEDQTRLEHLHVYWGAKEALYKSYGRRQLDFCSHIHIQPFEYDPNGGQFTGEVIKDEHHSKHRLNYRRIDDYILVQSVQEGE